MSELQVSETKLIKDWENFWLLMKMLGSTVKI